VNGTWSLLTEHEGQTLEHLPFDSAGCLLAKLTAMGLRSDTVAGTQFHGDEFVAHHGEWPGDWETSTDAFCGWCGEFLWHGVACPENCQAENDTTTTDRPERTVR
jgi:hypothetical protein